MNKKILYAHLAVFIANVFFGLNNPISRSLMPGTIDPIALTYFRMIGGTLLFWGTSLFLKREKVPFKDLLKLFFAAFFSLSVNQIAFYMGLSKTSPIDASIVVSTLPIMSMIFAAIIIKEPITLKKALGVLVGASGALYLIYASGSQHIGSGNFMGNIIVFGAVVSFSLYLTIFKTLIPKYSPFTIMRWMFLFASIQSYPFCHQAIASFDPGILDFSIGLRIAYILIFATFAGYVLLAYGQKTLLPTTLSMYNYTQPIIASLATLIMGIGTFGSDQLISVALVFAGVYIVTQSKTRAQIEAEKTTTSVEQGL